MGSKNCRLNARAQGRKAALNSTGSVSDLNFDKTLLARVQVAYAPRTVPACWEVN
jgi:hypothetical protein